MALSRPSVLVLRPAQAWLAAAALLLSTPAAQAQDTDFSLSNVRVLQIIENGALIADRPVTVRAMIAVAGPNNPVSSLDAVMRVYVNGSEAADSPVYSVNGPTPVEGNSDPAKSGTMLNFTYIPPASTNVVFEVQLNPPGPTQVPDLDPNNNTLATTSMSFKVQELLTVMYSPIDYRPSGGTTPNLPNLDLIKPGVGDNFVQGIYPGGEIEYRRTDAPSKLWTGSLASSGSALNSSLVSDLLLTSPQPDYIYGWVNGSLSYNGMAQINGKASMGNTDPSRHQRTMAHELGHCFGQFHNSLVNNAYGEDVERHLANPGGLKKVKLPSLFDIMVAGQLTKAAWIHPSIHNVLFNHPNLALLPTPQEPGELISHLLVSGSWDSATGQVRLDPVLEVLAERGSLPAAPERTDLVLTGLAAGQELFSFPLSASSAADLGSCADSADSDLPLETVAHFAVLIAAPPGAGPLLDTLAVRGGGSRAVTPLLRQASAHAPSVVLQPWSSEEAEGSTRVLRWQATDADGDGLSATVRYLPDGARRAVPLATHLTASELLVDLAGLPQFVPGQGVFELSVSDGLRTTRVLSERLDGRGAYAGAGGSPPFVNIYHPDDGFSFNKGTGVILHSSGWDLEDDALTGASISWSSDIDGALGTGRRFLVDDLSVGFHQITVTATDSGGQQTSVTHAIEITDRLLPDLSGEICAIDLGFGGPGSATVSLCGGDLTAGGSADLELVGGPANVPAYLALGLVNAPTPFKGGTLVPVPWALLLPQQTDGSGSVFTPGVTGDGTHFNLYLQYLLVDGAQPLGVGISNALLVQF